MTNTVKNAVVAMYDNHESAQKAVKRLAADNIALGHISVIGRGYHTEEKVVGFYNTGDRMKFWGRYGAFWGGLWGVLVGGLFLTIPAIGPVIILGQFASIVMVSIEGAAALGGIGALAAAFFSIGIPRDSILQYEKTLEADGFIVLVQGTVDETEQARSILKVTDAKYVDRHARSGESSPPFGTIHLKDAS